MLASILTHYADSLKPEAKELLNRIMPKLQEKEDAVKKIPVSVLIWGPSPCSDSDIGKTRIMMRDRLQQEGHLALFSEELCSGDSELSLRVQQLVQAEEFDVIISIPVTPGSIAEIHDFTNDTRVNKKIIVFLNEEFNDGYSNQSLFAMSSILSCEIIYYKGFSDVDKIILIALETIQKVREFKYIFSGRV